MADALKRALPADSSPRRRSPARRSRRSSPSGCMMRIFRLSLWPALPALAIAVEWSSYAGSGLGLATADAAVAVAFFVGALVVWGSARFDPLGLLFLATGLAWLLGTITPSL